MYVFPLMLYMTLNLFNIVHGQIGCLSVSNCFNGDQCSSNGRCYYSFKNQIWNYKLNSSLVYSDVTKILYDEQCVCNKGWESLSSHPIKCCYKQKNQLDAFMLEFFVGFGCGHFYINRNKTAITKLICCVCFCFYCYFMAICVGSNDQDKEASLVQKIMYIVMVVNLVAYVVWWFMDVILFGFNMYLDGNSVQLNPW
jgi:hypothetical protein